MHVAMHSGGRQFEINSIDGLGFQGAIMGTKPLDAAQIEAGELLDAGEQLKFDLYDEAGTLLLAAGQSVSADMLKSIRRRGITNISKFGPSEPKDTENESVITGQERIRQQLADQPYNNDHESVLRTLIAETLSMLSGVRNAIIERDRINIDSLLDISEAFITQATDDVDLAVTTVLHESDFNTIESHALTLGVLGMLIAREIPLISKDEVADVGIAGFLHEMSLGRLMKTRDQNIGRFSELDFTNYAYHPLLSFELCDSIYRLSARAKTGMRQVHEQLDGTGFPCGVAGYQINRIGQILNVANAFLTLGTPSLGRPAFAPYDALICLLHQVQIHRCDASAVRGLLRLLSLFPLGSHVVLDDHSLAQVIRSNSPNYMQPIVRRIDDGEVVNLAQSNLRIANVIKDQPTTQLAVNNDLSKPLWFPSAMQQFMVSCA